MAKKSNKPLSFSGCRSSARVDTRGRTVVSVHGNHPSDKSAVWATKCALVEALKAAGYRCLKLSNGDGFRYTYSGYSNLPMGVVAEFYAVK